jgi:hypothetical protein
MTKNMASWCTANLGLCNLCIRKALLSIQTHLVLTCLIWHLFANFFSSKTSYPNAKDSNSYIQCHWCRLRRHFTITSWYRRVGATTFSVMSLSLTTFKVKGLFWTQHKCHFAKHHSPIIKMAFCLLLLCWVLHCIYCYAERGYAECHYAECRGAQKYV